MSSPRRNSVDNSSRGILSALFVTPPSTPERAKPARAAAAAFCSPPRTPERTSHAAAPVAFDSPMLARGFAALDIEMAEDKRQGQGHAREDRNLKRKAVNSKEKKEEAQPKFTRYVKAKIKGEFANDYYSKALEFIKLSLQSGRITSEESLASLGALSKSKEYYFDQSQAAEACATEFLATFFANEENRLFIENNHALKFKASGKKSSTPSCIAFVPSVVNGESICYISISSCGTTINATLWHHVREFLKVLNSKMDIDYKYELLDTASHDFDELIDGIPIGEEKAKDSTRKCSEKGYGSLLTKLYAEHGDKFKVTGVANCVFFPFEKDKKYGKGVSLPPSFNPNKAIHMQFGMREFFSPTIICCPNCQANRARLIIIWTSAQVFHATQNNKEKIFISPVKKYRTPEGRRENPGAGESGSAADAAAAPAPAPKDSRSSLRRKLFSPPDDADELTLPAASGPAPQNVVKSLR